MGGGGIYQYPLDLKPLQIRLGQKNQAAYFVYIQYMKRSKRREIILPYLEKFFFLQNTLVFGHIE